jgi:DivIVA domain-containing protein
VTPWQGHERRQQKGEDMLAREVADKRFQPTKFREGYDQGQVDDFLDEVVVALRQHGAR